MLPLEEDTKNTSITEACSSNPQVLHKTKILDLMTNKLRLKDG